MAKEFVLRGREDRWLRLVSAQAGPVCTFKKREAKRFLSFASARQFADVNKIPNFTAEPV